MIRGRVLLLAVALVATGCSGGGGATTSAGLPTTIQAPQALVPTTFVFGSVPSASASTSASTRQPQYVTANVASVQIVLNTVNGGTPPSSVTTTVTTNLMLANCPCSVAGPAVPPGSDAFTLSTYDAPNAGGHVISTASPTLTIVADQANSNTITLNGVPATFTITAVPNGTAGIPFSAKAFSVTVKDADGNTITGTYANPVSLADSDTSATGLITSGSDGPPAGDLLSSSDASMLSYTGLAIVPATLTASASGATSAHATFSPTLQPIVYSGPEVNSSPEIDLYATSGVGSSATFTVSEVGWTNTPYDETIAATEASGCSHIATTLPASRTSYTTTAVASPASGTCTLTLSDFSGGSTTAATLTYTVSGFGVQSLPR